MREPRHIPKPPRYPLTGPRIEDAHGHTWPTTGHRCRVCHMPLHPMLADAGVHICCDVVA